MTALAETGLPVAAVRDGDKPGNPKENVFKLPGTLPPEKELLLNGSVQTHLSNVYGLNIPEFLAISIGVDHHEWFGMLACSGAVAEGALVHEAAKTYATSLPESEVDALTDQLKEAVRR